MGKVEATHVLEEVMGKVEAMRDQDLPEMELRYPRPYPAGPTSRLLLLFMEAVVLFMEAVVLFMEAVLLFMEAVLLFMEAVIKFKGGGADGERGGVQWPSSTTRRRRRTSTRYPPTLSAYARATPFPVLT
eukprot:699458-Rhodomonas_salina.1